MPKHLIPMCCVLVVLGEVAAEAQDKGQVGLTMAFPASVGLIWHATDRVALRPDLFVSHFSTEGTTSIQGLPPSFASASSSSRGDSWNAGVGVSALFYLRTWDRLRVFVSPRFTFTRMTANSRSSATVVGLANDSTTTGYGGSGSFGVQAALGTRLTVFGEAGLGYGTTRIHSVSSTSRSETSTRSVATRAGVGVALYF